MEYFDEINRIGRDFFFFSIHFVSINRQFHFEQAETSRKRKTTTTTKRSTIISRIRRYDRVANRSRWVKKGKKKKK